MRQFEVSIQKLLQLDAPLPSTLRDELQLGSPLLSNIDDDFKLLSSEIRIWTFSETKDSKLSGGGISGPTDIPFTAPIVSLRSAILGVRHERIYTLQSQHAECASFGMANIQTMKLYLKDLGGAIRKAQSINDENPRNHPLGLEKEVHIEVHGFYEDVLATHNDAAAIRAFSTKQTLASLLEMGPDELLEKRLNEIDIPAQSSPPTPREKQFIRTRSPRIKSEGIVGPLEQPTQRRPRRSSGASISSRSGRDPSPKTRSSRGLEPSNAITPGPAEEPGTGILEDEVASVRPGIQSSSLHPGYFPATSHHFIPMFSWVSQQMRQRRSS